MVNTLVNDWFVHKGSQSVLFVRTDVDTGVYKGCACLSYHGTRRCITCLHG